MLAQGSKPVLALSIAGTVHAIDCSVSPKAKLEFLDCSAAAELDVAEVDVADCSLLKAC